MTKKSLDSQKIKSYWYHIRPQRGLAFGLIILTALIAFEIFNFSTTDFALSDLIGDLQFMGLRWAMILAIAFCGIDFAGIARLFNPEDNSDEIKEIWYLFGAWLLAATMNAMLTWWGVSIALLNHNSLGNEVISRETLIKVVPIFVAVMVWLMRVLIIGTFSVAGNRLFSNGKSYGSPKKKAYPQLSKTPNPISTMSRHAPAPRTNATATSVSSHSKNPVKQMPPQEPTYQPLSMHSHNR